jgi:uncharacterized radical SAM superfamily Fe-S cluster-containing enzyme
MLIKKTKSLCPVCNTVVEADLVDEEGSVFIVRRCQEHGESKDVYWSDSQMYRRFDQYEKIGSGIENPQSDSPPENCPNGCGLCSGHRSSTLLANIDLTNRCNLNCDFCFANARACGFVYEPSFDEIIEMMSVLRGEKPVPTPAVQFSGGEPTMRKDLIEIIRKARELGFSQVQMATNGIELARDPELARKLKEAGLSTVYLHFDGVSGSTNHILKHSLKAVKNCDKAGLGMVLVPTVIKGRNDHEIGDIIRFAADHISTVRGINFQPIAFTGAASADDIKRERITIPELLEDIEQQTQGGIKKDDFYPVPCVVPFSDFVEAYTGKPQIRFTAHQHCGAATYVFVSKDGVTPVNRMVDVESFFTELDRLAEQLRKGGQINKYKTVLQAIMSFRESVKKGEDGKSSEFWPLITKALLFHNFDALRDFHWNALFIGTMHFMDRYNYDLSRVQRCCIHYATPGGRLIPFCTYNSGPVYRERVWKEYASAHPADQK